MNQKYNLFEIVCIDDFSTDNSFELVGQFKNDKIKSLKASEDKIGKKTALAEAISHAQFENLLFTDSDCMPDSDLWIESMVKYMQKDQDNEIVLGYGPMIHNQGLLNSFIRYETILTAIQYFVFALSEIPYMGVGRNLMYKKSLFEKNDGYQAHLNLASGDDDLLISKISNQSNTTINLEPKSFVFSQAKQDLISFYKQKTRHISTAPYYKWYHKILLGMFGMNSIIFYLIIVFALTLQNPNVIIIFCFILIKWITQIILSSKIFSRLDGHDLIYYIPFFDLLMSFYLISISISLPFKKQTW